MKELPKDGGSWFWTGIAAAMMAVVFTLMISVRMGITIQSLAQIFTGLLIFSWAVAVLVLLVLILRRLPPR